MPCNIKQIFYYRRVAISCEIQLWKQLAFGGKYFYSIYIIRFNVVQRKMFSPIWLIWFDSYQFVVRFSSSIDNTRVVSFRGLVIFIRFGFRILFWIAFRCAAGSCAWASSLTVGTAGKWRRSIQFWNAIFVMPYSGQSHQPWWIDQCWPGGHSNRTGMPQLHL